VSTGFANEPGSREPGLDQLIAALTADGHPHELTGRDAALAAFRAARTQPRRRMGPRIVPGASARVSAVAAALIAAFAGLTAAAYAKALPAPMQHIAYNVFSPLGVPDNQSTPAGHSIRPPKRSVPHRRAGQPTAASPSPSASPSCPCPTRTAHPAVKGSALALNAARVQLPANGWDRFTAKLTYHGHPEPGVRIRLLEQKADSAAWVLAGSGVTGGGGRVRVGIPHVKQNATFRFAGPDGVGSTSISVTVIPRVLMWRAPSQPGTDRLVAAARFGDAGDIVELQKLAGGTWQNAASGVLDGNHRASFTMPANQSGGHYYRVQLAATNVHGASVSAPVFVPRVKNGSGAKAIVTVTRVPAPGGVPSHPTHRHGFPGPVTPGPVLPGPVIPPGPVTPGPVTPGLTPTPVVPGPVAPSPGVPGGGTLATP